METLKCCVGGCAATGETLRFFCFPRNSYLRSLWMSFLSPTNPILLELSEEQLLKQCVCQKHFDQTQFDEEGKRIRFSYTCRFTENGIALGEPLSKVGFYIFGNMNVLKSANQMWRFINDRLVAQNAIGKTISLRCDKHRDNILEVTNLEDLEDGLLGFCLRICENNKVEYTL